MGQPNNYGITEEITLLAETVRRFYKDNYTDYSLHELVASDSEAFDTPRNNWVKPHWQTMVELGWSAVSISTTIDGMGMPLVAAVLLAEETGKAACPSPLVETLKSSYLLNACFELNGGGSSELALSKILEGEAVGLAVTASDGLYHSQNCDVSLDGNVLNGTAYFVQDALKVDSFIVKVKSDKGFSLYKISSETEGMTIVPDVIGDLTRDQAHLQFNGVVVSEAALLAKENDTVTALVNSEPAIHILTAADIVGSCEWLLQTTAEYARTRVQFDRPIGFFQAVKHPLVDVMIAIDEAKSLVYNAACAFDHEPHLLAQYAHMAKASAADAADIATQKAIQLHGGIGITWECFVHVFAKRVKHNQFILGDGGYHKARIAELLLD